MIRYSKVHDVPVNYLVLSLLKESKDREPYNLRENEEEDLQSEGVCPKHAIPNHFICIDCHSALICGTCLALRHRSCKVLKIKDGLERFKKRKIVDLEENMQILNEAKQKRSKYIENLQQMLELKQTILAMERQREAQCDEVLNEMKVSYDRIKSSGNVRELLKSEAEVESLKSKQSEVKMDLQLRSWIGTKNQVHFHGISNDEIYKYIQGSVRFCLIDPIVFLDKVKRTKSN